MSGSGVVGRMSTILRKADRIGHLVRHLVNRDCDPDPVQDIDDAMIEVGNRLRLQRQLPYLVPAGARDEAVAEEVKVDLENFAAGRDRRRPKPACGNVQRHLPAMVEPGCQAQPDLAHDLSPQLQRCGGLAPAGVGQIGPNCDRVVYNISPANCGRFQ